MDCGLWIVIGKNSMLMKSNLVAQPPQLTCIWAHVLFTTNKFDPNCDQILMKFSIRRAFIALNTCNDLFVISKNYSYFIYLSNFIH